MRNAKLIVPVLVVIVGAALIGALAARSGGTRNGKTVKTMKVGGKTLLVNRRGMTLYHLSVERRGHFICTTSACLEEWHPLVVARGMQPSGAKSLTVVKRPDGRRQVAYKGGPLYTFDEDHKPGDVKGDGFRDVGVWHVVTVAGKPANTSSSGGGYGGGFGY